VSAGYHMFDRVVLVSGTVRLHRHLNQVVLGHQGTQYACVAVRVPDTYSVNASDDYADPSPVAWR
jgi:hypothetical protein